MYSDHVESKNNKSIFGKTIETLYKDLGGTSEEFFKSEEMEFIKTIFYES